MTALSPNRIQALLKAADETDLAKTQGDRLEDLLAHVLQSVPGVKVIARNVLDVHGSGEIDVGALNSRHPDGLADFEQIILVECKNWKVRVGAVEIRDFGGKLKARGRKFGILAARSGITGDPTQLNAAQHVIAEELRDGREIVIITAEHLSKLRTSSDFVELLLRLRSSLIVTGGAADLDWYADSHDEAAAAAPEAKGGVELLGWDAVRQAMRLEQEHVARSMIERAPELPGSQDDATELLIGANNRLHDLISEAKNQGGVSAWQLVLDAMLELGAIGVAFLWHLIDWEQDEHELVASVRPFAPNMFNVHPGTKLFQDLVTYYTLETDNGEDLDRHSAAMGLVGLLIEAHWRLEEGLFEVAEHESN